MRVVHVAQIEINPNGGMGRIAFHWREAFLRRGHEFIHVGPGSQATKLHIRMFPYRARREVRSLSPDVIVAHEPASGTMFGLGAPVVLFSHGIERRGEEVNGGFGSKMSLKSSIVSYVFRIRIADRGLRRSHLLMLSNEEDKSYAQTRYGRTERDIFVFRNGANPNPSPSLQPNSGKTVAFVGSWLPRKGIRILAAAAELVQKQRGDTHWILAGTGDTLERILATWPESCHASTTVIPSFAPDEEQSILARAGTFALPSYLEGQPLSLVEAMNAGQCCVTTRCCGQMDLIESGTNGLLVEPGDVNGLAAALNTALGNDALRKELGRRARESVADRSWELVSNEVVDHVEATCRAGR